MQRMKQEHNVNEINRILNNADTETTSLKKPVQCDEYGLLLPVEKDGAE